MTETDFVLEAGSLRSGCQHGQVRALFPVAGFLYPYIVEGILRPVENL